MNAANALAVTMQRPSEPTLLDAPLPTARPQDAPLTNPRGPTVPEPALTDAPPPMERPQDAPAQATASLTAFLQPEMWAALPHRERQQRRQARLNHRAHAARPYNDAPPLMARPRDAPALAPAAYPLIDAPQPPSRPQDAPVALPRLLALTAPAPDDAPPPLGRPRDIPEWAALPKTGKTARRKAQARSRASAAATSEAATVASAATTLSSARRVGTKSKLPAQRLAPPAGQPVAQPSEPPAVVQLVAQPLEPPAVAQLVAQPSEPPATTLLAQPSEPPAVVLLAQPLGPHKQHQEYPADKTLLGARGPNRATAIKSPRCAN